MTLNPIQFGKDVIDQFGRYLLTTFPLADPELGEQFRRGLSYEPGSGDRLAKGPYIFLNRPFVQGPGIRDLLAEPGLGLHPALEGVFPFATLHRHQEEALRAVIGGRNLILSTGTGSGKTEAFLLPILDYCLKLRDSGAEDGVAAVLVYPMNALVNDQLERLRRLLAGTRITFGRYTGETPETGDPGRKLTASRPYTAEELRRADERVGELPVPWEECATRAEIRQRRPRLLLTNYSQLEYLLLRDRDLDLFRSAPLRFFVLDEVHTYTGAVGSEVACLLRRLRQVAGKSADEVLCIGSSATVVDEGGGGEVAEAVVSFASRLFGVPRETVALVREEYEASRPAGPGRYVPPPPGDAVALLERLLPAVREAVLADEPVGVPSEVIALAEKLCGRETPGGGDSLERLHRLLEGNRFIEVLQEAFADPHTLEDVRPRLEAISGRRGLPYRQLQAEALCYLTLGALARFDGEPLLRPKLHYFVQGLHGLWLAWEEEAGETVRSLRFSQAEADGACQFPLSVCRSCGQHYLRVAAARPVARDDDGAVVGVSLLRGLEGLRDTPGDEETEFFLTGRIVSQEEGEETTAGVWSYICRFCGALHDAPGHRCRNPRCSRSGDLVPVLRFDALPRCAACGTRSTEKSPIVTPVRSLEAYDVMVLAQTMLAAMAEPQLRKLLIFADSRQDAAFQAGWMESRSLRFRVRHMLYQILERDPERPWFFPSLLDELVEKGVEEGVVPARGATREAMRQRLDWMLVEELFALSERQRRNSLERLGMARVEYEGLEAGTVREFARLWSTEMGTSPEGVLDLLALILDVYRLKHAVSHPMLQRRWSEQDREVRNGIVTVGDYFRPQVVTERKTGDPRQDAYVLAFRSTRGGGTTVERLVAKVFPAAGAERQSAFLDAAWEVLVGSRILVPVRLHGRWAGRVHQVGPAGGYQVNLDLVQVRHTAERWVCHRCGTARGRSTPNGICPAFNCDGRLELRGRDAEHFDVVQYTRFEFVPLLAREHSAQVPKESRMEVEREFKRSEGKVNCLVATPTLEMGVDIGSLEMVGMRNVPPSPANYAQRSGRAGRRHRIGVVMTYCRGTQHDQYFYADPPAMIAGAVGVPAFSMRNEPLIRKHVHSAVLTALRGLESDPRVREILGGAFPTHIWQWFATAEKGRDTKRLVLERPRMEAFADLIRKHRQELLDVLTATFTSQWPPEDGDVVAPEAVERLLDEMPHRLEETVGKLVAEVRAYHDILGEYRRREDAGEVLKSDDLKRRKGYEAKIREYLAESQENYTLSYLARAGFFPGYALVRDAVKATSVEPPLEISRNLAVALRELTPANRLYANGQQFKVRRMDFYRLKADRPDFQVEQLVKTMYLDTEHERIVDGAVHAVEGGEYPAVAFTSLQLIDVELDGLGRIGDQEEYRRLVGFKMLPLLLEHHGGGHDGRVGTVAYRWRERAGLRLVNLGPTAPSPASPLETHVGFPVCTVCGAVRSPFASMTEIENFTSWHREHCGQEPQWEALHVDIASDLLLLGPFENHGDAINVLEAVRIDAQQVLEVGQQELEVLVLVEADGREVGVMFDPFPGGSGLLPLVQEYWEAVVGAARRAMDRCDCERTCYSCLLDFRNQQYHQVLDRFQAIEALAACSGRFVRENTVSPNWASREPDTGKQDSGAEEDLLAILTRRGFPQPVAQFRVDFGGGRRDHRRLRLPGQQGPHLRGRPLHRDPRQSPAAGEGSAQAPEGPDERVAGIDNQCPGPFRPRDALRPSR